MNTKVASTLNSPGLGCNEVLMLAQLCLVPESEYAFTMADRFKLSEMAKQKLIFIGGPVDHFKSCTGDEIHSTVPAVKEFTEIVRSLVHRCND